MNVKQPVINIDALDPMNGGRSRNQVSSLSKKSERTPKIKLTSKLGKQSPKNAALIKNMFNLAEESFESSFDDESVESLR